MVLVEKYHDTIYAVKFHLKSQKKNNEKYSYLTGDGEPSVIVWTVMRIMLQYVNKYPNSSFIIMAAHSKNENAENVKRFRLYKYLIRQFISDQNFYHKEHPERNIYLLLRKTEVDNGNLSDDGIIEFIDGFQ